MKYLSNWWMFSVVGLWSGTGSRLHDDWICHYTVVQGTWSHTELRVLHWSWLVQSWWNCVSLLQWTTVMLTVVSWICKSTPGNPGNLLEFKNPPGNPGNLLEFNWSSWKFLCKISKSTTLVSSHKNMDEYLSQNYEIYRHQMCSFKFQMHQNPFSAGAPPRTLWGSLWCSPRFLFGLGGDTKSWNTHSMGMEWGHPLFIQI